MTCWCDETHAILNADTLHVWRNDPYWNACRGDPDEGVPMGWGMSREGAIKALTNREERDDQ